MALSYTNLFSDWGKLVKHFGLLGTEAGGYDAAFDEIEDRYALSGVTAAAASLRADFESAKSSLESLRQRLGDAAFARLQDRVTVINELDLPTDDPVAALAALIRQMVLDSQSVNASVVTVGSLTAAGGNTGDGTVLLTKVLDGASSPAAGVDAHPDYAGVDSELAVAETMTFACVADSYSDGVSEGSESFQWDGEFGDVDPAGVDGEGSGSGPIVTAAGGSSIIQNGTLESFTSNVPDSWTVYGSSIAGTHVLEESGATNFYRGSKSVELIGDAALASLGIAQFPSARTLAPLKRYCVSLRYKATAIQAAGQTLTVQFEGTGYTPGTGEKIEITGDVFSTTWALASFFVNIPSDPPADFKLVVKLTGTPEAAKSVYVDDVFVTEVAWHGGIGAVVVPGATPFVRGDRFSTVLSTAEGVFQEFARKMLRVQLPSNNAAGETISDTLAS